MNPISALSPPVARGGSHLQAHVQVSLSLIKNNAILDGCCTEGYTWDGLDGMDGPLGYAKITFGADKKSENTLHNKYHS